MLVMTRHAGEAIQIGDSIEIVITHIGRSRVKVGIRAPREMKVAAKEVELVRAENLAAAQVRRETVASLVAHFHSPSSFPKPHR